MNFFRHRTWIVALIAMVAIPFALNATVHLPIGSAGVHEWLPSSRPEKRAYDRFQQQFGSDQTLLVSWDGATIDDPRIPALASKLQASVVDDGFVSSMVTTPDVLATLEGEPLRLRPEH